MLRTFDPSSLFNCCTDLAAPEWSRFSRLELGACVSEGMGHFYKGEEDTITVGGQSFDDCEFYTVYGRNSDDEAEAITDIALDGDVLGIVGALMRLSGLPCDLYVGL